MILDDSWYRLKTSSLPAGRVGAQDAIQQALDFTPQIDPLPPVIDPAVPKSDKPRLCRMSRAILERLRQGAVTNSELAAMFRPGAAWRTRLSDVRQYLQPLGETVDGKDCGAGLWLYEIRRLP